MVRRRIDAVYTDGIDSKLFEEGDITLASSGKSKRIDVIRGLPKSIVGARHDSSW